MARMALVPLILALTACASTPQTEVVTEQVKVPVPTMPDLPERLAEPYAVPELPEFMPPETAGAVVALDQPGVEALQDLIDSLDSRRRAWRTWWRENHEE